MLNFILGFLAAWVILSIIAYISETTQSGGIALWDGWAVIILLLPIYALILPIRPIYVIITKNKKG